MYEQLLLIRDAIVEEVECGAGVRDERERVGEQQLRADRPPEEAKVRRVAQVRVDAVRHELVLLRANFEGGARAVGRMGNEARAWLARCARTVGQLGATAGACLPLPLLNLVREAACAEADEAAEQADRRHPAPLLAARVEQLVDQEQLGPILDPCDHNHQLVRGRVVEKEVVEGERVGPERGRQE
eukprot:1400503-Prymnesium_polylepis.1